MFTDVRSTFPPFCQVSDDKIMISARNNFHSSPLSSSPADELLPISRLGAPPPQISTSRAPFLFQHYLPFQFPRTHNDLDARAKFTTALEGLRRRWTSCPLIALSHQPQRRRWPTCQGRELLAPAGKKVSFPSLG